MSKDRQFEISLSINGEAVSHNLREIRKHTQKKIIAVIKHNGYGTGLLWEFEQCRKEDIDFFAVNSVTDALKLRKADSEVEILLLTPVYSVVDSMDLLENNIIFMLGSRRQAEILEETRMYSDIIPRVHIKIDTGLGRYGFSWNHLEEVRKLVPAVRVEGCYTHFALQRKDYLHQIEIQKNRMEAALETLRGWGIDPGLTHAAATKAFVSRGDLGFDAVRIGSLILGRTECRSHGDYRDAVSLNTEVYDSVWKEKGSTLGYDGSCRLHKDTQVGIIRSGCADGAFLETKKRSAMSLFNLIRRWYHRLMKEDMTVEVNGETVSVLGKPGMEYLLIDLENGHFKIGDPVKIPVNPLLVPDHILRKVV